MATYGDIARRVKYEVSADRAITDADMVGFVYDAMREVAHKCVPLKLVTQSNSETILRWIDDMNFIRVPLRPIGTLGEKIDMDDLLMDAVIYFVCKRISRDRKKDYDDLAREVINDYIWAIYEGETNVVPAIIV